ncbi:MAG TPA: NADH-quinone oxidoreductase subunit K [Streptosporangiaceae bacterium]
MTYLAYAVAGWLFLAGSLGIARSRHLVQAIVALSIAQSGTYVLLLGVGFQRHAAAPVFTADMTIRSAVVDPVVQAMTLTDIVVSATITALLAALAVQAAKLHGTADPDDLRTLQG